MVRVDAVAAGSSAVNTDIFIQHVIWVSVSGRLILKKYCDTIALLYCINSRMLFCRLHQPQQSALCDVVKEDVTLDSMITV